MKSTTSTKQKEVPGPTPVISTGGHKVNPFVAKWSAKGNTLCLGHWQISYCGLPLTLPSVIADNHMNSFGNFSFLFPDEPEYEEGLAIEEWLEENAHWLMEVFELHQIPFNEEYVLWFYQAVNEQDWRCSSCGGCI